MSNVNIQTMMQMETAGFGECLEERIFFTGPTSTRDPMRLARIEARKAASGLLHTFVKRGHEDEAHCERVAVWSRRLAREVGLSSERVLDIELGALLHDIGFIGVNNVDFGRRGSLTYAEWFEVRRHCELGAALLREIPVLRRAIPLVASHHESFDGTGYPRGAKGLEIPIDGRIFHLVDAFESLTTDRPYRGRRSDAQARAEIARCVGSHFDPLVHAAFDRIDSTEWRSLVASVG